MVDKQTIPEPESGDGHIALPDSEQRKWETRNQLLAMLAPLNVIEAEMQKYPSSNPLDSEDNHSAILNGKQWNADLLKKIWGGKEDHSVFAANTMQHVALFCIPAITASAHLMQKTRYRDEAKFGSESSRTSNMLAKAVLQESGEHPSEDYSTYAIAHHHLPPEDRQALNMEPKTRHERPVQHKHGIPHCAMAFSLYESLRAAEFIAERQRHSLTPEERETHYRYFSEILQRSGYRCPSSRSDMESIAVKMDMLSASTPTAKDMVQRALNHLNTYDQKAAQLERAYPPRSSLSIPQEWIREFLRPHSQKTYDEIIKDQ